MGVVRRRALDRRAHRLGRGGRLRGGDEREDEVERSRLDMMRRYAEHTGCRRSFLLSYFGQDYPGPCGNCDNDLVAKAPGAGARAVRDRRAGHERALG